ncbi:MAG: 16S rRNA (guanine(966)-N(2))-methyltransferase RsmD [Gemmatimonadota bacterium]
MRIIAGQWRGRRLRPVRGKGVRPTTDRVRESWMAALGDEVADARVLDLFAGSGALGLEALSRGARNVTFVEKARGALTTLSENIFTLEARDRCTVIRGDAMAFARKLDPGSFDLALADPPYHEPYAYELLSLFAEKPFARTLWVEHCTREPMPDLADLRQRRYGDTTLSILTRDE